MDLTNFKVEGTFSSIEVDGRHRDLHNNFRFSSLEYNIASQELTLLWFRRDEDWVASDDLYQLKIVFSSVSLFKVKERDEDCPFTEDDYLSTIGFIGNDILQEMEGFAYCNPSPEANHLNLSFESGFAVKISASKATCIQA